jgi:hypothetical protein
VPVLNFTKLALDPPPQSSALRRNGIAGLALTVPPNSESAFMSRGMACFDRKSTGTNFGHALRCEFFPTPSPNHPTTAR